MCRNILMLLLMCALAANLVLGALTAGPAQAQPVLLAGAAKAKITPQGAVWLAGYGANRRSVGVHDDLWARALVLKSGEQQLALASVDLLGFPYVYVQRVREIVQAVPDEAILVAATHVHSGPDVIGLWGPSPGVSGVDPAYVESVIRTVAQVIEEAAASLAPATLKCAAGPLPGVSQNINVAELLDPELGVLQAVGQDGKVIATLVNFACHPEIMQNQYVTADFPNWTYQRLEQAAGGVALFINGALGGMVTANIENIYDKGQDNWQDAERIGAAIAQRALELLAGAEPVAQPVLSIRSSVVRVPLANQRFEAAIAAGVLPEFREEGKIKTEVAAGVIGEAQFATIPGEGFPALGLLLKQRMTSKVKFIFGLTQDELGYIMPREDYGTQLYDYETSMSVGPEIGPMVVEALQPLLQASAPSAAPSPLDAWVLGLRNSFNSAAAANMNVVYYFRVTGEGGGDYTATIANGQCTIEKRKPEKADVTITVSAADAMRIASGEIDPVTAWMMGKVLFDGDMALAESLVDLFGF